MTGPLLEISNLRLNFHTRRGSINALRGVDFQIYPQEIVGLVGESGCGKSLTAHAILKLLPPTSYALTGEVLLNGENLLLRTEKKMQKIRGKQISLIGQDPATALNPTRRLGDQLIEGLIYHEGLSKQTAWDQGLYWLEQGGIGDAAHRMRQYPHEVSGGMKQRILIAMALACRPSLIIADEPTTALDVTLQAHVLELLKTARQNDKTSILFITHDLAVVAACCDRLLVMYAGQIVESGCVKDLLQSPQHPYTQALIQAKQSLTGTSKDPLYHLSGSCPLLLNTTIGCAFAPRCLHAMSICEQKQPLLENTSSGKVACWLPQKNKWRL